MATPTKRILLLALDEDPVIPFDGPYAGLIAKLASHAKLLRARTPAAANKVLLNPKKVDLVLVIDQGIFDTFAAFDLSATREDKIMLDFVPGNLFRYVNTGGTVVFCCHFVGIMTKPPKIFDSFWPVMGGLQWKLDDFTYERHTVNSVDLGQAAKEKLNMGVLKNIRKAEAVLLKNVPIEAQVLVPQQRDQSRGSGTNTAVALSPVGAGWVGYSGLVGQEDGTDEVLLAMLGGKEAAAADVQQ